VEVSAVEVSAAVEGFTAVALAVGAMAAADHAAVVEEAAAAAASTSNVVLIGHSNRVRLFGRPFFPD
jgi:hypothetical protein